ncbi:MAG: SDR family NAD(P)-dependent oxidoreductase [Acidimicrobiales bacterium]
MSTDPNATVTQPSPSGPPDDESLADRVALVTGSSSGIGAALARRLARLGATVVVNSARSVEAGQALADQLPGADYVQADVADEDEAHRLVETVLTRHGRLDLLVNNAGTTEVIPHHDLDAATPEVWRRIFDVNVIGTWQVTVAAVPHLRTAPDGQVVNVSSLAGERPTGSSIPYACSKAALSHMTRLLANTLGPDIRVNAVAPGLVDTPWTEDWDAVRSFVTAQAPLGRTATPDDVAEVILGLVRSRYVTGEVVLVDGGVHLR